MKIPRIVPLLLAVATLAALPGRAGAQELFEGGGLEFIPADVERMYTRGIEFLAKSQGANGAWTDSYGSQPGVVGLAVLAMLAHGDDPNHGPYATPVKRALGFILGQQNKETGYIGTSMYNHGFATLALAEAYGHVADDRLGPALQRAVKLIVNSQAKNPFGAWRYGPEARDADTTVSGAQVVALFAARNAGLAVPQEAIDKALEYYVRCQSEDGGFGYTGPGGSNGARTAIGCLVFSLAKKKDGKTFKAAFNFLANEAGVESYYYHYFLYYASQAFFHASERAWDQWNNVNVSTLKAAQRPEGSWESQNGPVFTTASSLLSLALNYRYLPIYER